MSELDDISKRLGISCINTDKLISSSVCAIIVDLESETIEYATELADDLFEYIPGELIGKSLHDLVPLDRMSIHKEHVKSYKLLPKQRMSGIMGTNKMNLEGLSRTGEKFPVEIGLFARVVDGKVKVIATILKTDRRHDGQ